MTFGTTYCKLSHLPIEDGDKCILVPLVFKISATLRTYNQASVNDFLVPYRFVDEPREVIYEGNPTQIKYTDEKKGFEYDLFMLIHFDFWHELHRAYNPDDYKTSKLTYLDPVLENVTNGIYEKQKSYFYANLVKQARQEPYNENPHIELDLWEQQLIRLADFMGRMDIIPTPSINIDQNDTHETYREILNKTKDYDRNTNT